MRRIQGHCQKVFLGVRIWGYLPEKGLRLSYKLRKVEKTKHELLLSVIRCESIANIYLLVLFSQVYNLSTYINLEGVTHSPTDWLTDINNYEVLYAV